MELFRRIFISADRAATVRRHRIGRQGVLFETVDRKAKPEIKRACGDICSHYRGMHGVDMKTRMIDDGLRQSLSE